MIIFLTFGLIVFCAVVLWRAIDTAKPVEIVAGQWYGQPDPLSDDVALVTSIDGEIVHYIHNNVERKGTRQFFIVRYPYPHGNRPRE